MRREAAALGHGMTSRELARQVAAERPKPVGVVLMAHGAQERLASACPHAKELLTVRGEPILHRTIRMLGELAPCKVGLCAPAELGAFALAAGPVTMRNGANVANETLICNMHAAAWPPMKRPQLFLLGDVVWSRESLRRVVCDAHPAPVFYGRHENKCTGKFHGEIFALRVAPIDLAPFRHCKSLWELQSRLTAPFREMTDWTDDVDTPEDLEMRLPVIRAFAEQEATP